MRNIIDVWYDVLAEVKNKMKQNYINNQIQVGGPNDCPASTTTAASGSDYVPQKYGWICPKCGRVYSPSITICVYCGGNNNIMPYTSATPSTKEWWRDYCTITSDSNELPKQDPITNDADIFCVHYDQLPYYTTITAWS